MVEFLDHLEVGMALLLRLEAAAVEVNTVRRPIFFNVVLYVFSFSFTFGFGYEEIYTFYVH